MLPDPLLALVAACVALTILAQRLAVPSAVTLVLGGMALAFVPGLPEVELNPELALVLFLPPLLQLSAYHTDWPAFRSNLRPILLLAVGAVFFTATASAAVAKLLVPDLPWWAAVALGAILAPPDAVAASAVLKQVRMPKWIVTVLEGESLINDASSLVLYRFAVGAVVAGSASYGQGVLLFFGTALGGVLVGWLVARIAMWVFTHVEDTLLDITVSLLAGFAAYLAAERLHASGVLAAVMCGLVLGRQQHAEFSARTRLDAAVVWGFVEFLLTALVFMLIGLQLRGIVARLEHYNLADLALLGGAVSLTLILSRFVWVVLLSVVIVGALAGLTCAKPDAALGPCRRAVVGGHARRGQPGRGTRASHAVSKSRSHRLSRVLRHPRNPCPPGHHAWPGHPQVGSRGGRNRAPSARGCSGTRRSRYGGARCVRALDDGEAERLAHMTRPRTLGARLVRRARSV